MNKTLPLLALALLAATPAAADDCGPYLQSVGSDAVILRFSTDLPTVATVELQAEGGPTRAVHVLTSATDHKVALTGLTADTAYFYVVRCDHGESTVLRRHGRFRTLPAGDRVALRLAHLGGTAWEDFADTLDDCDPHLLLAGSGRVGRDGPDGWARHYADPATAGRAAVFPAIGPGNYGRSGLFGSPLLGHLGPFHLRHTLPGNEEWYSLRIGQVQLFVLNSTWYADPVRLTIDQLEWADGALREASDGVDDPTFRIVLWAAPAPGAGDDLAGLAEEAWTRLVSRTLLARRGVDLVLGGTGTTTEHVAAAGVDHVMTASGAPTGRRLARPDARPIFSDGQTPLATLVDVVDDRLTVRIVDAAGRVHHEFAIEDR